MTPSPALQPSPKLRPRRFQRFLVSVLCIVILVALAAIGGWIYIRSERFNRYVAERFKAKLLEFGLRGEVSGFGISWDTQTARLRGLKIYNLQTGQLVATVERADTLTEIRDLFALKLSREIVTKKLDVEGVELYYEIDRLGRTNWDGVHDAPPAAKAITLDTTQLLATLAGGAIHFKDHSRKVEADLREVKATAQPQAQNPKIINLQLNIGAGRVNYEGRENRLDRLDLAARVSENGAEIDRFDLKSSAAEVKAKGRLDVWSALRYSFDFDSRLKLNEAAVDSPAVGGFASINGHVEGQGADYNIRGGAKADEVAVANAKLFGIQFPFSVEAKGDRVDFTSHQIRVRSLAVKAVKLAEVSISDLKGEYRNGASHLNARAVNVAVIETPESKLAGLSLNELTAKVGNSNYEVQADVALSQGAIRRVEFSDVSGRAVFDETALAVTDIKASLFGGTVTGDYVLPMAAGAAQKVKAGFTDVETKSAAGIFDIGDFPVSGLVKGEAELSIAGSNLRTINGVINAHFDGQSGESSDSLPVTGDVAVNAQNGVFNFERMELSTGASKLEAAGQLSVDGESDLRVSINSTQSEQLVQLARAFEEARTYIEQYEPQLIGNLKLEGRVTGPIDKALIEAGVNAETFGLRDAILGAFAGRIVFSPDEARVENGLITASNADASGSSVKFSLVAPLDKNAQSGRLDAVIDRMNLETILAASGSPSASQFITGDISGEAHLTGLPAASSGAATFELVNGRIADQPAQTAKANLKFEGRNALIDRLEVQLPQSHLTASGSMNLDDYSFRAEGKADRISLANFAEAFELKETHVEGSANADFEISGKVITGKQPDLDWESLKLELNAQGKDVKVNGRDAGKLELTAHTSPGGRIDAELITGILAAAGGAGSKVKPEKIKASVELRKPGRPVIIESDLADLDVAPLIGALAPDLNSLVAGTINGKLRVEGPSADESGNVVFDRLRGGLTLTGVALAVADNPVKIETPATIALEGAQVTIPNTRITGEGADLRFGGTLGLSQGAAMNFSLNGTVNLDLLPAVAADLLLYGTMTVDARVGGTLDAPNLSGHADVAGFGLSASDLPIFVSNGSGRFALTGEEIKLERFAADANDGRVEITGSTRLDRLRPQEWRYDIKALNAEIAYQEITATINGNLVLAGTPQGQTLSGQIVIPQAEFTPSVDIDNLALGGSVAVSGLRLTAFSWPGLGTSRIGIPPINLDVRVEARDSLVIQNDQINTIGTAILTLGGPITDPVPTGRVTLDGGTWRFRGQRYEIAAGSLDLPPTGSSEPLLNMIAEGELGGFRVSIGLIGPLGDLDLTLRSEPQLTRDEILSLITTGRTEAGSLGSQDPLRSGFGAAASLLSSGFISRPTEQLLGLSRFQIDPVLRPNANPAARLTVGQQFSRNLYLSYSTNLATEQDQTALTEYTLSNRFSALATYTQGGSSTRQGLREGVFTIELRGRQRFPLGFRPEQISSPGEPNDALTRIVRPKLPEAQVKVSEVQNFKLSQKTMRELLPVMTQGFSQSLMRLGERRLREHLQESGYFFAEVKWRCEPENCNGANSNEPIRVFYDIQPNVIYDLKEIRIEGTDLVKLKDIQGELQSQTASAVGGNPFLRRLPFVSGYARGLTSNGRLNNDEETIRRRFVDMGFRNARVKSRLAVKPDSDDLIVIFDVEVGEQSEIAGVAVRGNMTVQSSELFEVIPVQSSEAFSFSRVQSGAQQIRLLYAGRGFLQAAAEPEIVELDGERVRVIYNIVEGARAVVTQIEINGTTKTGKGWVRRYFDFKHGDVLTPEKIRRTQRDLYSTNAFREVNVRAEPLGGDDGSAHRVSVNLAEAKPLLFVYGLGYSTDDGVRGLAEIANTNLGGSLDSLSLRLRGSRREQFAQISFTDLRPFSLQWPTTVAVFYNRTANLRPFVQRRSIKGKEENFEQGGTFGLERFAAFIQTERKLNGRASMRFRYNLERARLTDLEGIPETAVTRNERAIRLGLFSAGISHDTRDSVLNPTGGQLISADHSIAARFFGGNESFNKFFATYQRYKTFDQYTTLLGDSTLAFSARIGLASTFRGGHGTSDDDYRSLPISERFFSGGATTLRGFRFETAGPQIVVEPDLYAPDRCDKRKRKPDSSCLLPALVPLGGDALAVFNFELRYPLTRRLRLVPFYDLGNVFERVGDIRFGGMTNTVGVGLRVNTPLGPIGVDYGFLIDPPSFLTIPDRNNVRATLRQPRGAIHIRFGQTF